MNIVGQAINPSLPLQDPRQTLWRDAPLQRPGPEQPHPRFPSVHIIIDKVRQNTIKKCSDYFLGGSISSLSAWMTLGALSSIR